MGLEELEFGELWELFLRWRVAVLEWGLSPRQVFAEVDPQEGLDCFSFLSEERGRVIERLLLRPDREVRAAFSEGYREWVDWVHGGSTEAEWWEWWVRQWLEMFLGYAMATVPPNYRRRQLLLFPEEGLEMWRVPGGISFIV